MIFATVGTHEQSFDRLIKEIDRLVEKKIITEEVFIQTGYTGYKPKYCSYKDMISYDEMVKYTKEARIIITHGGPGSIFLPIQYNKKPIAVPRNPEFNEHVDQHQIDFVKRMANDNRVYMVLDINELSDNIINYKNYIDNELENNSQMFVRKFSNLVDNLF